MRKSYTSIMAVCILAIAGTTNVQSQNSTLFYESFNNLAGIGGNDGHFDNYLDTDGITTIDICVDDLLDATLLDNSEWDATGFTKVAIGDKCVRLSTKKNSGEMTTPNIAIDGNATLSFNACAQLGDATTMFVDLIGSGTLEYNGTSATQIAITLPATDDNTVLANSNYTIKLKDIIGYCQLKFSSISAKGAEQRFFLDEIKVVKDASTTSVESVAAESNNNAVKQIYTIYGQHLPATSIENLPNGIYIVNGEKVAKM